MVEGHGDDAYRYGDRIRHNFSSNIFTDVDHSSLVAHLASLEYRLKSYPEPYPASLEAQIADKYGLKPEEVMVTNGVTEAIYLVAAARRGKRSDIIVPTFREYQDACRLNDHDVAFAGSPDHVREDLDTVWLCNPNNPTGTAYDRDSLADTVSRRSGTLFVVDQAYAEYTDKAVLSYRDGIDLGNAVILSSPTKRYAIPGLRIGYAVARSSVLDEIRRMRMPWSVNALAIAALEYLIRHDDDYPIEAARLHGEALRLAESFSECGISVAPTDCNFILCRLPKGNSAELKDWLANEKGILIRDASNFETLSSRHFRVAAQSAESNDYLIKSVLEWLSQQR